MKNGFTALLLVISLFGIVACAALDFTTPGSVNLSGSWVVETEVSQQVVFPKRSSSGRKSGTKGGERGGERGQGGRGGKGGRGGERGQRGETEDKKDESSEGENRSGSLVLRPAMANAKELNIDHVNDSMGILYDNGKYRDIDWGETKQRNTSMTAGWKNEELIVTTEGRGKKLKESYSIDEQAEVLTIRYTIEGDEYLRVYTRKEQTPTEKETAS